MKQKALTQPVGLRHSFFIQYYTPKGRGTAHSSWVSEY